ncbi:MAG: anthranilate phosphoribosyltransferase [Gammaproteobacteria bacterium]|nr:anthranilate phosphoribosyltransferase [Gammaproteobacteria bacterium]
MNIQQAISAVIEKRDLTSEQMTAVMSQIMTGEATPSQIGGFLVGLRMKGETVDEIAAAATVMRELSTKVKITAEHLVDTCGTGGDSSGSFNISTASAIVAAAAGASVAKHGNRSVTSKSGSADVLEAAGVSLDITPEQVAKCIEKIGVGFLFAPKHHSAMKHAIAPRKEMAVRTIFNVLGPLTNPAGAPNQVMGVFSEDLVEPIANVLKQLASNHVMVVHSDDGLDEISIGAATYVAELKNGEVTTYRISPQDFGFATADLSTLKVEDADASLEVIRAVFNGNAGPAHDIVALNAGAAIYVSGLADSLKAGVATAVKTIAAKKAAATLNDLIELTNNF